MLKAKLLDIGSATQRKATERMIRPIWQMNDVPDGLAAEPADLLGVERKIVQTLAAYVAISREFEVCMESDLKEAESLLSTAAVDLTAGCEMARFGYLKQAYSLWRSWFEQVVFAVYFLEAPLHRLAWKVSEAVTLKDSPKYRLMLHQLLNDSGGERHPFALIFSERFLNMYEVLKTAPPRRDDQLVKRAEKVLTLFSQGVHGTYRPKRVDSIESACTALGQHGTPNLKEAWVVVSQIWILFLANSIDLPEEGWNSLRNGTLSSEAAAGYFEGSGPTLLGLNESFKDAFGAV